MQPEEAVEIDHRVARNIDGRPHGVICLLAMRDHNIQSIGRAALEDDHQSLVSQRRLRPQNAARVRKAGIAAVPTTASAPLRRNTLRVMDIKQLLASSC